MASSINKTNKACVIIHTRSGQFYVRRPIINPFFSTTQVELDAFWLCALSPELFSLSPKKICKTDCCGFPESLLAFVGMCLIIIIEWYR